MAILETKDLRKIYGSRENEVHALDGVSISVEEGEFVAVIGTSGSGKSTLLNMIGGLDRPTSGSVTIRGKELLKMKDEELTIFRRRNIPALFFRIIICFLFLMCMRTYGVDLSIALSYYDTTEWDKHYKEIHPKWRTSGHIF